MRPHRLRAVPTIADRAPPRAARPLARQTSWIEHDLSEARDVQRAFFPPLDCTWRGVEIVGEARPAHQVGGDFFEVATRPGGRLCAVVGDVSGKGVAAALIAARASQELRRHTAGRVAPARMLARLNRWLDGQGLCDRFVTAACVELDLRRRRWLVASAGHPAALLVRRNGAVEALGEPGGPALGLGGLARWNCPEHEVEAWPGDTLLMMTDGLTDVFDRPTLVALAGAAAAFSDWPAPAPLSEVKRRVFELATPALLARDDATLVGLRIGSGNLGDC
jgi:sigma-B regulation protein RsbU (phosphoserine phosphatase)